MRIDPYIVNFVLFHYYVISWFGRVNGYDGFEVLDLDADIESEKDTISYLNAFIFVFIFDLLLKGVEKLIGYSYIAELR